MSLSALSGKTQERERARERESARESRNLFTFARVCGLKHDASDTVIKILDHVENRGHGAIKGIDDLLPRHPIPDRDSADSNKQPMIDPSRFRVCQII